MGRADDTTVQVESIETNRFSAELRSDSEVTRERAWNALFSEHYARVYRFVCRYGVASADVEDVTQRTFVVAFQRIQQVSDVRDPVAWLYGIAVRVVAQHRRWRRVREAKRWLLRDTRLAETAPVVTPEQGAVVARQLEDVRSVIGQLSGKLRDVMVLCDIEERTPAEAAEILGIPVNTVRSRRRLARARFHELWLALRGRGGA